MFVPLFETFFHRYTSSKTTFTFNRMFRAAHGGLHLLDRRVSYSMALRTGCMRVRKDPHLSWYNGINVLKACHGTEIDSKERIQDFESSKVLFSYILLLYQRRYCIHMWHIGGLQMVLDLPISPSTIPWCQTCFFLDSQACCTPEGRSIPTQR